MINIKKIRKYTDLLAINLLGLLIAIVVYYKSGEKPEIPVAIVATAFSISFGIRSYSIESDKIFKELFKEFNEIYTCKFNEKLNEIIKSNSDIDIDIKSEELIIDYLNFCAEEYLWYKKGRIDEDVWAAWRTGILFYFKNENLKRVIIKELQQKDSYYGLFDNLKIEE